MVAITAVISPLLSSLHYQVTVDSRGVRALGLGVVPWVRIPLEQIEEEHVTTIDGPLGQFGGGGYRGAADGSGAWGVVTAAGTGPIPFPMANVVVACDKFKGSLTVEQVAERIAEGIRAVVPEATVTPVVVADGGDGTLHAALQAGFERVDVTVEGPTGEPVATAWARRGDTGLVEMADACGLMRLPEGSLRGLEASSHGLGQAMAAALDAGVTELVVGVGGSASTDGGAGMLAALGARLLDADGRDIGRGAGALGRLETIDLTLPACTRAWPR